LRRVRGPRCGLAASRGFGQLGARRFDRFAAFLSREYLVGGPSCLFLRVQRSIDPHYAVGFVVRRSIDPHYAVGFVVRRSIDPHYAVGFVVRRSIDPHYVVGSPRINRAIWDITGAPFTDTAENSSCFGMLPGRGR
jgi:hypothetical protein